MKLNRLWLLLVLLLSTASDSLAQKQFNNWYFGSYSGLNFNTNPPTFQTGALITAEGSAGVSDANGNLLFYTDGITVYNRRHLVMPNGFGMLGHSSSTHSALIVPDPASPHRYYVFTTGTVQQTRIDLHYSIVDMREDGGLGDVVFKNMRLLAQSTEHIIGVSACGEDNYWIITRKLFSNDFYAWYLDASGIRSTPVISTVDVKYGKLPETGAGWLTSNPKGDMLAMAHGSSSEGSLMQLFKFDRNTGIVSDPISLPGDQECYAAAFSADGSKVYFGGQSVITKLDVTVYEKSAILATQYSVPHGWRRGVTLKLAPDKNIYARGSEFLGRITNANSDGFAFDRYFMVLPPGNEHSVGLPNDPIKNLFACPPPTATLTISDDSVCESNCIEFTGTANSEITEWNWSFEGGIPGTSNLQEPPSICYSKSGSYNVRLIVANEHGSDTVVRQVSVLSCPRPAIVLADTTICISECITFVDTSTLSTTWKWEIENGIPSTDISRVTQPICYSQLGGHKVRLIAANEYGADTAECLVTVIDCSIPKARVQHDTSICVGEAIDFRDQSEGEIHSFSWEFSAGAPPSSGEQHPVGIRYARSGRHRVRLIATNDAGSDTVDSWVTVNECEPPVAAISDHTICEGDSILFTDEGMNYPTAWQWKFDGGTPTVSTSRDPGYVHFDEPGIYPIQLIASNEYGSDTADATITVISASPTIRPAELAIEQPLNTCVTFDTAIWIHAGCKEVMYELESSGMMYIDVTPKSQIIPANDSLRLSVQIRPVVPALVSSAILIDLNLGSFKIPVSFHSIESGGLDVYPKQIDFGESSICATPDSTITLTNTGCDTIVITNASVTQYFRVGGDYPIRLEPGQSVEVPVTALFDTTDGLRSHHGIVRFESAFPGPVWTADVTRSLVYPTRLRIEASDEASGIAGDVAKFTIILEGEVPSTMTALHFDFLHNNDLLGFESINGAGLQIVRTAGDADQRQSFTLSPVRAGELGEVTFKVYLAEAEQTTLSFDNISFEAAGVSFAPECIAVISDSSSRFDYVYTCGDNVIRDRLNGTMLIKSITPNPASGEIRVELNVAGGIEVSLFNALGTELLKSASDRVDVSALPSGVYYVRVAAAGIRETRRIVVER